MTDRITMLNRALLRIGADALVSEAEAGADVHLAVYDGVLENLSAHPWTFMKATRRLVRLTGAPERGYRYAFQMPADRIAAPRGFFVDQGARQPVMDYEIEGDLVLCDHERLWGRFIVAGSVAAWPGNFREAFTVALMAELALSVREDRTLRDRLIQQAFGTPGEGGVGGLVGQALTTDNQGEPSTIVGGGYNPLIDVR